MNEWIFNVKESIKKFLLEGKTISKWLILFLDFLIVSWSFSFSFLLVKGFNFVEIDQNRFFVYVGVFCITAMIVLYFGRMHTGLLRYSNSVDLIRIFSASVTFSVAFLILILLFGSSVIDGAYVNLFLIVLINFFICTSLLVMLRITARNTYQFLTRRFAGRDFVRTLIYGSDRNAVLVKQALEANREVNYVVVGFIDTNRKRLYSYMEQKKVYHFKELPELKKYKKIDQLVIVHENLDERSKKVVIERAIRLGIKIITVPPTSEWLSGTLDKKQMQKLKIEDLLQRKPIKIDQSKVKDDLCGKRVLITGAAGSIGSEIVRQVMGYNPALLILCDNAESPLHSIQLEIEEKFPDGNIEVVISDVRDERRMEKLFKTCLPQVVYHAAAYKHVPLMENNPFEAVGVNVGGTKHVADLAVKYKTEKFVMVSTDKAVNPTNVMGASKRLAEIYIQSLNEHPENSTRFITTRFGNVLGSNGSVIPRFRSQIEKGGPITVTHPEITRYFMTIPEAVQLVLEAGTMGQGGEIFVFDMGKPVKIIDMAKKMIQLAGFEEGKDIKIVFSGLRPGEKLYEELLATAELTLPTHHEKISIAKVRVYPYEDANKSICDLIAVTKSKKNEEIVRKMKEIVPEFLSKNSIYEQLDQPSS
ncbi:polysaccharide biosynthesis protein [Albibacterium indicum]|uniref:polysaccharide biosynthesis protein n=1 Tax=Albibacterium indicum TaxID=2292082 RepID=UPI000E4BE81E|nr:nucleoside-diphosphate sugar epimerase/dehydratase [Pedobacter indicus]